MYERVEIQVTRLDNRVKPMLAVEEAHRIVRLAAEPWMPGDCVKAGINRAARALELPFRRAKTFWYQQPCAVLADEMTRLRERERIILARRQDRLNADLEAIKARLRALDGA